MKKIIPQFLKNIYHLLQAVIANFWFGFPSRQLKVIGVTGTNGKTTTVQMIAKILEEEGYKIALASTINFKIAEKEWVNKTKFTTLSSFALQKFLKDALVSGCDYAVLEISSHSLDQNRVWGVDFDVAVVTNITREHLDYHKTMLEYAKTKESLFQRVSRKVDGTNIVNLNMNFAKNFLKFSARKRFAYFVEMQDLKFMPDEDVEIVIGKDIESNLKGSRFSIGDFRFTIGLPGAFNIENALAATCAGLSQGISLEKISVALGKIKAVPGRMEHIENELGIEIVVDYAVTPDSLEKLYGLIEGTRSENSALVEASVSEGGRRNIIAVFGSCGERDRGKRPIMGEIVGKAADFVFVTNEDPFNEDPQQIIDEVFSGVSKYRKENMNAWRILDRREAIKKALQLAKPGDIVVVTGKGAEETMAIGNERIPWNDPKVIREILRESSSAQNQEFRLQ